VATAQQRPRRSISVPRRSPSNSRLTPESVNDASPSALASANAVVVLRGDASARWCEQMGPYPRGQSCSTTARSCSHRRTATTVFAGSAERSTPTVITPITLRTMPPQQAR
jgi:hypothetical protein